MSESQNEQPSYSPEPIDTDGIELSGSLRHLREVLAENVHDRWALGRLAEGWTLGPERDDEKKTNPTLVPYSELPESEREYDRTTAEQTLKAILKLGYRIEDPPEQHFLERYARKARAVWDRSGGGVRGVRQVMALRAEGFHWGTDPSLYCELTGTALAVGDLSLVYELANEGLRVLDETRPMLRLARDRALAMAHEGRYDEAGELLLRWLERCKSGSAELREINSALGRLSKEQWYDTGADEHLQTAIEWYRRGFEEGDGDVFPAINVATLHALGRRMEPACEWARKVLELADDSEWGWASQGEAQLILGHATLAEQAYRKYYAARRASPRDIAASRKQAERLIAALSARRSTDQTWLDDALPLPSVLVFAGVVPDREAEAGEQRFPATEENRVRSEIRAALREIAPVAVYCAAAAGSDILLLEEAAALKIETQIILPASVEEFRRLSVEPFGKGWTERFDAALAEAARIECLGRHFPPPSEQALMFRYGNHVLVGSALLRARRGGFSVGALAVWDGEPPRGPGGTGEFVAEWNQLAHDGPEASPNAKDQHRLSPARVIRPSERQPGQSVGVRRSRNKEKQFLPGNSGQEVRAMLFADVKNFSTLTEELLPQFQNRYMRQVSELLDMSDCAPVVVNTWGDAIYMVFDTVRACGEFALAMSERLHSPNAVWRTSDLPSDLAIRTAVHAGPAFRLSDPVTREFTYTGSHVTHAARLEPVTQPGQVYGTEAFAALAALNDVESFHCHYVGQRKMAKNYGSAGVYRLVTARPAGGG